MKILAIAPYEGLKEIFKKVGSDYSYDLEVELSDLCSGAELSRKVFHNQADVIISRGGTASYIDKEMPVPVIEVEVSGYDILRILTFIKDYEGKKGLIAFPKIANGARTICEILNIDISIYAVKNEEEVQQRLEQMKQDRYEVVVGDVIAVQKAESIGLNGFLLTSGEESVKKAFDQAKKLVDHLQEVKTSVQPLEDYFQIADEAIAIIAPTFNQVYFYNKSYEHLLKNNLLTEAIVLTACEQMYKSGEERTVIAHEENYWELQKQTLENGSIALTCKESIMNTSKHFESVEIIGPDWQMTRGVKTFITTGNQEMKQVLNQAKNLHSKKDHVWINGSVGTGKESLAYYIHFGGQSEKQNPLAIIHCDQLKDGSLPMASSESGSDYTVLLLNIERLTYPMQQQLFSRIQTEAGKIRYIVTSNIDIEEEIKNNEFHENLYKALSATKITVPLLEQRIEDIEHLSLSFIHECNLELGKQVVGLRPDALSLLKEQTLEGNINQLKAHIKECVRNTETPYIERGLLELVIKHYKQPTSPYSIDLTGTLEDIEARIIYKIWNEEGQNRTKTAKRLGINRTTLWRRLNREQ